MAVHFTQLLYAPETTRQLTIEVGDFIEGIAGDLANRGIRFVVRVEQDGNLLLAAYKNNDLAASAACLNKEKNVINAVENLILNTDRKLTNGKAAI